ncbi:MAG: creatininase family protein [Candidatus Bathyarchaeota archaeon]|nr:creatininase family protein [Candidatus Bathyarchaeota archaeon]
MGGKFLLYEMSWVEAKEYFARSNIAVLPVGSTEQHGPANPLGTDHLVAKVIAEEVAKRTEVLCLPTVPFGVSSHHRQFWGTISVSPRVFKAYVKDVCLALYYYGVRKIVVVNGHGGNLGVLSELARELREKGIFLSVFQWWTASAKLLPELFTSEERLHASAEETSVNLALFPHLVATSKTVDEETRKHPARAEGVTLPLDTVDFTSCGVWGKSTAASADKGEKVLKAVIEELVWHVEALKKAEGSDLESKSLV